MSKALHLLLIILFTWVFLIAAPYLELKQYAGRFAVDGNAYAIELGTTTPPLATDLSEPSGALKYAWARMAGKTLYTSISPLTSYQTR